MQQNIALVVTFAVLVIVILPFFTGKGGKLAAASTINDPGKLEGLKKAILQRYLDEEHAMKEGDISEQQWKKRSALLSNRYIDVSKKLDFLKGGGEKQ